MQKIDITRIMKLIKQILGKVKLHYDFLRLSFCMDRKYQMKFLFLG